MGSYRDVWDVAAALDAIAHRGPDGRGIAERGDATLGHVRLAIQDPQPRSAQPFVYEDVTLTYVGECWDADRLRERLAGRGCEFTTTGDTEVVAAALWLLGTAALRELDGMFALAWHDARDGRTRLARDRLGKVPMYWRGEPGGPVTWSSERRVWGREGAFAEAVPPGTCVDVASGEVTTYYDLAGRGLPGTGDLAAWVLGNLRRAVSRRLVSDVPVAFLSSGGLDSSLILALVREVRDDVVAYTAVHVAASPDLLAAREVCDALEVELREVAVPPPDRDAIRACVGTIEFPMKAQVEIAWPCLHLARRIADDGFKVVLSGEGADEVFGGYGSLARKATSDQAWRQARRASVVKMGRGNFPRANKAFMSAGVEARLPFMELPLVEAVLAMGVRDCPPQKRLLKAAAAGLLPDRIVRRKKETFQGATGVAAAFHDLVGGNPTKTYNQTVRDLYGGLPTG